MSDALKTPEPFPTIRSCHRTENSIPVVVRSSPAVERTGDINNGTPNSSKLPMKSSAASEALKLVKPQSLARENLAEVEDVSKERRVGSKLEKLASFVKGNGKGNATSVVAGKEASGSAVATGKQQVELKVPVNPFARVKKV